MAQDDYTGGIAIVSGVGGGQTEEERLEAEAALLDAVASFANGDNEVLGASETPASPPLALEEVAGVSETPASPPLALTGNEVSVPLAIGSSMIGAGSLLVLVARKRND